jgi:hypothetical protein
VTGIAIARAVLQSPLYTHPDYPLYREYNGTYFTLLEINFAIIVICLPPLYQLFCKFRHGSSNRHGDSPGNQEAEGVAQSPQHHSSGEGAGPRNNSDEKWKKRSPVSLIVNALHSDMGRSFHVEEKVTVHERTIEERDSMGSLGASSRGEPARAEQGGSSHDISHMV